MKRITIMLAVLLTTLVCHAVGWNDFTLDIGDGYNVFRANSMDVCIGKADRSLILYPRDHDKVGPVVRYITTPDYILTKNFGRIPRNLFEGDTFQNVDPSQEYFFVIAKANDEVLGPFLEDEFMKRPEVTSLGDLDWLIPKNPNFWLPLFGSLMFLVIAIPILAIKFFWITVLMIVAVLLLIRHIRKKRKEKAQQAAARNALTHVRAP